MFILKYLPIILIPAIALITSMLFNKIINVKLSNGQRTITIDGLRGFLALFVVTHHAAIWMYYIKSGVWQLPPSRVYANLGQLGVVFFFMITSFLFISKIRNPGVVNWAGIYKSRLRRLFPMYLLSLFLMLVVTGFATAWSLNVTVYELITSIGEWASFAIIGMPDINGFTDARLIGGVAWSLVYEWLFYLSLPVLALTLNGRVKVGVLIISMLLLMTIIYFSEYKFKLVHVLSFVMGGVALFICNNKVLKKLAVSKAGSLLTVAAVIAALNFSSDSFSLSLILFTSIAFTMICSGSDIFGILKLSCTRILGESTYSIYLLHQVILYSVLKLFLGVDLLKQISEIDFWIIIFFVVVVTIMISHVTYKYIELPWVSSRKPITNDIGNHTESVREMH